MLVDATRRVGGREARRLEAEEVLRGDVGGVGGDDEARVAPANSSIGLRRR